MLLLLLLLRLAAQPVQCYVIGIIRARAYAHRAVETCESSSLLNMYYKLLSVLLLLLLLHAVHAS